MRKHEPTMTPHAPKRKGAPAARTSFSSKRTALPNLNPGSSPRSYLSNTVPGFRPQHLGELAGGQQPLGHTGSPSMCNARAFAVGYQNRPRRFAYPRRSKSSSHSSALCSVIAQRAAHSAAVNARRLVCRAAGATVTRAECPRRRDRDHGRTGHRRTDARAGRAARRAPRRTWSRSPPRISTSIARRFALGVPRHAVLDLLARLSSRLTRLEEPRHLSPSTSVGRNPPPLAAVRCPARPATSNRRRRFRRRRCPDSAARDGRADPYARRSSPSRPAAHERRQRRHAEVYLRLRLLPLAPDRPGAARLLRLHDVVRDHVRAPSFPTGSNSP